MISEWATMMTDREWAAGIEEAQATERGLKTVRRVKKAAKQGVVLVAKYARKGMKFVEMAVDELPFPDSPTTQEIDELCDLFRV